MSFRTVILGRAMVLGLILCGSPARARAADTAAEKAAKAAEKAAEAAEKAARAVGDAANAVQRAAGAVENSARMARGPQPMASKNAQKSVSHEGNYEFGFYGINNVNARRSFAIKVKADEDESFEQQINLALETGRCMFEAGSTLSDPGIFKTVDLKEGETLVMGVHGPISAFDRWLAVRRMKEPKPFLVSWDSKSNTHVERRRGSETLSSDGCTWFRVYFLDGQVRFAFLPDTPSGYNFFRLVGKYEHEPIKAGDEEFSYFAVLVNGAFNEATALEATKMGLEMVQRSGISLANPGLPQKPIKLGDNRYLVVVAYDAARNESISIPVKFGHGNSLWRVHSKKEVVRLDPYNEQRLGGFQIPFVLDACDGDQLSYSVGFPH